MYQFSTKKNVLGLEQTKLIRKMQSYYTAQVSLIKSYLSLVLILLNISVLHVYETVCS